MPGMKRQKQSHQQNRKAAQNSGANQPPFSKLSRRGLSNMACMLASFSTSVCKAEHVPATGRCWQREFRRHLKGPHRSNVLDVIHHAVGEAGG